MKRGSLSICLATAALLAALPALAAPWNVSREDQRSWMFAISGGAFRQTIEGKVGVEIGGVETTVDVRQLGLSHENNGWGEIDLQLIPRNHLRFAFLPFEFDGDESLSVPIEFGGTTFDASDHVSTRVKLHTYELSYRFDIHLGEWATVAPLLQMSVVDGRVEVTDETLGLDSIESQWVPIPAAGVRAEFYPIGHLGVFGEAKGFTIGKKGTMWDAQGGLRIQILKYVSLLGSYRVVDYDVDYKGVHIDTRLKGPFAGATLQF